jgi:pimeloyl-ACP methyl ester carboxylesterase
MDVLREQVSPSRPLLPVLLALALGACMPPSWGAGALLHPGKTVAADRSSRAHETLWFDGSGVRLKGWWFRTPKPRRGTIVYLHGVADNRGSSAGIADHFVPAGFDVIAYDSRAHGESEGDACTYGYYEKVDLGRVLDKVSGPGPIVLLGTSLGAAVALQAAAEDNRVGLVVAAETFSDLRTVASGRAPFFASKGNLEKAFRLAENEAKFKVDDVSPVAAAAKIRIPVLVIHGEADAETPPSHSVRVHAALAGPKELILVRQAGHNGSLTASTWKAIDVWIEKWVRQSER